MEVEKIPIVCILCDLSLNEKKKINPQCAEEKSLGHENCKVFKSETSKQTLRTREQLEWLTAI